MLMLRIGRVSCPIWILGKLNGEINPCVLKPNDGAKSNVPRLILYVGAAIKLVSSVINV